VAPDLAQRLDEAKGGALRLWEERARRTVPGASDREHLVLLDGLPDMLDELVRSLARGGPAAEGEVNSHNASHLGRQRAIATDFSLDQVLREYEVMRQVLFEVLERSGPLTPDEREALQTRIEVRIRGSAREFVRVRDEEREGSKHALQRLNEKLEHAVEERTAELSRTERRFSTLVDGVKDYAIYSIDPRGFIASWNGGAERMTGYSAEEVLGVHYSMLYPEEARLRDDPMMHLRAAAIEGRFRGEGLRRRKNGEEFLADALITPMYEGHELTGFSKVVQDLSERNILLQERDLLRMDTERLRSEATYRERFVASLSHDLRSPLSAAKTGAQLIALGSMSAEKTVEVAQRISDSTDRADRMIVDLLDATRLGAGQTLRLELEECDLLQIGQQVTTELAARHGPRFKLLAEGPAKGMWNADALRRVLENLLSNAVKYGTPATPITIRLRRSTSRMILLVHNQGDMIHIADQAQLFEPFRRTADAETSGREGWGLGLALVRGIVEALRGEVSVSSYPNEGTTFTVVLPLDSRA